MSQPPLSEVQRAAVGHPFEDALVTAGAGSGKTRVLTERFVHLVREGSTPLRRLAALTFTEKAAAQMRARIAARFGLLADAVPAAEGWRADVEFAPVSTIHAFCASLLRQHAVEAGVDPAFQVLDAVEAELLREDAAQLAESAMARDDPALIDVLHTLAGDGRVELLSLLDRLRGAGRGPEEIEWQDGGADVGAAADAVEAALDGYAPVGGLLPEPVQPAHGDVLVRASDALAQARGGDPDVSPFLAAQARAAVATLKDRAYPRPYSTARTALERALEALTGALLDRWGARVLVPVLRRALAAYDGAYAQLKDERSALDFADLELRARDLLRDAVSGGRPLDLLPRALLVDEYQDTNPLQAEILASLRAGAPQFSVGDPKQSIYRFRRADVHVILRERERLDAAAVHAMNASYRACPPLVAGINAINARLFEGGRAGVDYEALEAQAEYLPAPGPVLELAVIDAGSASTADVARPLEAAWIAARIEELVEGGTPRLAPKRDGEGRATRESVGPLRYGDVAILFRAATALPIYEAALAARGIPYLTQKSKGYFQADEITDLLHVLRAVHNPEDRFALACAVTGPALGAGDDDLLRWFAPGEGTPWERMGAEADAGGRHAGVLRTLRALRVEAASGTLADAVERALIDLGLYETALLQPGGDRRAANLRKAIELARQLDHGGRRGLADLLRHLATLRGRELGESEAPVGGEADDVVRLTTVHGAKGLEYPVVFVADVGRRGASTYPNILYDGGRRVAAKVADPLEGIGCVPAGYGAIKAAEALEGAQEEQRLLYVAMTRAEERLILSGWCKGEKKSGGPAYFAGWGGDVLACLRAPFEPGRRDVALDDATCRVHVVPAEDIDLPPAPDPAAAAPAADAAALARAERRWSQARDAVAPLGETRYVVSVSELLAFAESPERYYVDRVVFAGAREREAQAWDAPAQAAAQASDLALEVGGDPEAGRGAERALLWDEPGDAGGPVDRAAVGRVVHAVIERLGPGDDDVPEDLLHAAAEGEGGAPVADLARGMVRRFLASATGRRMRAAMRAGEDVRREVALHARVAFPGGETVGGFPALLVKGSIDLWLPSEEGVWIVDHKTNRAGARYARPEDVAAHYAWQLRLYALAVERVLGMDVAGARLLLLDPGWGPEALEVAVDVSGPLLEETRRLCQAFAVAELEGRYPREWRSLLP